MSNVPDKTFARSLVWFRRDLRCFDHAALYHALRQSDWVACVFIFDSAILASLPNDDRRVKFIYDSVKELSAALAALGGNLMVVVGDAVEELTKLVDSLQIDAVFTNHDYEPYAIARDANVAARIAPRPLLSFKDQVIFEKSEVLSQAGTPFSVFTPYKNAWLKKLLGAGGDFYCRSYPIEPYADHFAKLPAQKMPTLAEIGFPACVELDVKIPGGMAAGARLLEDFLPRLSRYDQTRNFPAIKGPSYLSVHLRFGTVSIRHLVRTALDQLRSLSSAVPTTGIDVWLSELIWRDFYFMILHHHPHVVGAAFKPAYDAIAWEQGPEADALFQAWCDGKTGYPLVDAAMCQLNQTGYMHNRLRMVTACFLVKDLGIDWRWGEAYFAEKLNDFDLAANNGGWQWAASTGCDAQPYFRIFNPITQSEKFDADGKFIKRYLPQLAKLNKKEIHAPWLCPPLSLAAAEIRLGQDYPFPIVDHASARERTLLRFSVVKAPKEE